MKYFSVEEAEAIIPELEKIFEIVAELAAKAQAKAQAIDKLERARKSDPSQLAIEQSQLQFLTQAANEQLQTIVDLGAVPKGLEPALVDFPARVDGREAYLCWKLGEKSITHYHGVEEGFGGRKPLKRSLH
jgi:hypothetical protein